MVNYQSKNFVFTPTFQSNYFVANSVYFGTIVRITADRFSIIIQNHGDVGSLIRAIESNGTWSWDKFALNSNLNSIRKNYRLMDGHTINITFSSYGTSALIFASKADSEGGMLYIYSNGYFTPIVTSNRFTASLSADFRTITIKNNDVRSSAAFVGVINTSLTVDFTITEI